MNGEWGGGVGKAGQECRRNLVVRGRREAEMGSRVGSVKLWREGALSPGAEEADGLGWCGEERS